MTFVNVHIFMSLSPIHITSTLQALPIFFFFSTGSVIELPVQHFSHLNVSELCHPDQKFNFSDGSCFEDRLEDQN